MTNPVVDIFMVYAFLQRLTTPFDKTDAYRLGLIDKNGKRIKKAETPDERRALGYFDRLVFNLKRLLAVVPGGNSRIATFAAALLLLREEDSRLIDDKRYLYEQFKEELNRASNIMEDMGSVAVAGAPTNHTGTAVVGTGDDKAHWSKKQPKMGLARRGVPPKYGQPIKYNPRKIGGIYVH